MLLSISQENPGLRCGMSHQVANMCLKILESEGMLRVEQGGITVIERAYLGRYGE